MHWRFLNRLIATIFYLDDWDLFWTIFCNLFLNLIISLSGKITAPPTLWAIKRYHFQRYWHSWKVFMVHGWLRFRQIHVLLFFQRFKCYTTLIFKNLIYINKIKFLTSVSKIVVTYINLTLINIRNNIIKQYYSVIRMFKVLVIVKKKQFNKTNILFRTGLSLLISKLSLISRIGLWFLYAKMVNSSKDGILLEFRRWSRIALSFNDLTFPYVNGDIPICSPDLTFKCLFVSP